LPPRTFSNSGVAFSRMRRTRQRSWAMTALFDDGVVAGRAATDGHGLASAGDAACTRLCPWSGSGGPAASASSSATLDELAPIDGRAVIEHAARCVALGKRRIATFLLEPTESRSLGPTLGWGDPHAHLAVSTLSGNGELGAAQLCVAPRGTPARARVRCAQVSFAAPRWCARCASALKVWRPKTSDLGLVGSSTAFPINLLLVGWRAR
jgi:hypothetical protein